ncbi:MAG: DUF3789 domain-containing protein [Clostridiales bacterium]|jgi:hypothetical protein|nr:DUF3789 domain-containing protein [Clostridiales bacterium]
MSGLLIFLLGFVVGGIFGVCLMCMVQINRDLPESGAKPKDDSDTNER